MGDSLYLSLWFPASMRLRFAARGQRAAGQIPFSPSLGGVTYWRSSDFVEQAHDFGTAVSSGVPRKRRSQKLRNLYDDYAS